MNAKKIKEMLNAVSSGQLTVEKAFRSLKELPYEDLSFAKVDHHRHMRQGIPEVIFAQGKQTADVVRIARALHRKSGRFLITRASEEIFKKLRVKEARFHRQSKAITAKKERAQKGLVLVLSAGTSDIPVAEEAAVTARFLGSKAESVFDIGVAGIHRLLDISDLLRSAMVIIVVAGMEGALPSVVGGLVDKPVIAVPTSVGYGTHLGGLTALFAMLNSCVPGIAVMNIDNGFGAGCLAHRINSVYFRK